MFFGKGQRGLLWREVREDCIEGNTDDLIRALRTETNLQEMS
jgi:hypothetical protein